MSDPNWTPPEPGEGSARDVNREGDIAWDGNDPERYAGEQKVQNPAMPQKRTTKATKSKDADTK